MSVAWQEKIVIVNEISHLAFLFAFLPFKRSALGV